jgi:hypothetical protein
MDGSAHRGDATRECAIPAEGVGVVADSALAGQPCGTKVSKRKRITEGIELKYCRTPRFRRSLAIDASETDEEAWPERSG